MAANDIRNVDDASETGVGSLTAQVLGRIHVLSGKTSTQTLGGYETTQNDEYSESDPNNVIDKYDVRLDDPTYYG